jgi:transcriptional regulator with XRE-family HTH domain
VISISRRKREKNLKPQNPIKNWPQEDRAGESGLDRSYVSELESQETEPSYLNPTYLNLLRIARTLGTPLLTLLVFGAPPTAR